MNANDGFRQKQVKRPWWLWALPAIVAVVVIAVLSGGFDSGGESAAAQRTASADVSASAGPTIGEARKAVDNDRYDEAIEIVAGLNDGALRSILRRIANRLGERAIEAVRAGDPQSAREFVIAAKTYPPTHRTRVAYATYKRASARAERDNAKTETAAGGDTATPTAKAPA